jgi:hypothetical protein
MFDATMLPMSADAVAASLDAAANGVLSEDETELALLRQEQQQIADSFAEVIVERTCRLAVSSPSRQRTEKIFRDLEDGLERACLTAASTAPLAGDHQVSLPPSSAAPSQFASLQAVQASAKKARPAVAVPPGRGNPRLPAEVQHLLLEWLNLHADYPYPEVRLNTCETTLMIFTAASGQAGPYGTNRS